MTDERVGFHDASTLLTVSATIAAITVALATISEQKGPHPGGFYVVPLAFLITGNLLTVASLYAMGALWEETGLSARDDWLGRRADNHPTLLPHAYLALVVTTWGLWSLSAIYLILLIVYGR